MAPIYNDGELLQVQGLTAAFHLRGFRPAPEEKPVPSNRNEILSGNRA
jgi:hypothetical protein